MIPYNWGKTSSLFPHLRFLLLVGKHLYYNIKMIKPWQDKVSQKYILLLCFSLKKELSLGSWSIVRIFIAYWAEASGLAIWNTDLKWLDNKTSSFRILTYENLCENL
jgi:hypothetical protein